ncbi:MAG: hypothetical protein FWF08_01125 [Oscillospiraceae bacterium]|nr:hypothetical protein [Oscillospiraceae bacterium]
MSLIDAKTLAYINMFAILGSLENLTRLSADAGDVLTNRKPIKIAFDVKGGPKATLTFKDGRCRMREGIGKCDIKIPFSSCAKFNGLMDGTTTPIPTKGFRHIKFLLKEFTPLTDMLAKILRPSKEDLENREFFELSTTLTFYVLTVAVAQIANHDEIGRFSAAHVVDGDIHMVVEGGPAATLRVKNHHILTHKCLLPDPPKAKMAFESFDLMRAVIDGGVNTVACIGEGSISMGGDISMLDNLNRILDRAALYLS